MSLGEDVEFGECRDSKVNVCRASEAGMMELIEVVE